MSAKTHKFRLVYHGTMNTPLIPVDQTPDLIWGMVQWSLLAITASYPDYLITDLDGLYFPSGTLHALVKTSCSLQCGNPWRGLFSRLFSAWAIKKNNWEVIQHIWRLFLRQNIHPVHSGTRCVLAKLCKALSGDEAFYKISSWYNVWMELEMILKCRIILARSIQWFCNHRRKQNFTAPRRYRGDWFSEPVLKAHLSSGRKGLSVFLSKLGGCFEFLLTPDAGPRPRVLTLGRESWVERN